MGILRHGKGLGKVLTKGAGALHQRTRHCPIHGEGLNDAADALVVLVFKVVTLGLNGSAAAGIGRAVGAIVVIGIGRLLGMVRLFLSGSCVIGVFLFGVAAGSVAVVNIRTVEGRNRLHGLAVVQILTPDIGACGSPGPQQVSHLAGGKGRGELFLNIGCDGSTIIRGPIPQQWVLVGVAVLNRCGTIEPAGDAAAVPASHLSLRPAIFR